MNNDRNRRVCVCVRERERERGRERVFVCPGIGRERLQVTKYALLTMQKEVETFAGDFSRQDATSSVDIILCAWLGSKHQPAQTSLPLPVLSVRVPDYFHFFKQCRSDQCLEKAGSNDRCGRHIGNDSWTRWKKVITTDYMCLLIWHVV